MSFSLSNLKAKAEEAKKLSQQKVSSLQNKYEANRSGTAPGSSSASASSSSRPPIASRTSSTSAPLPPKRSPIPPPPPAYSANEAPSLPGRSSAPAPSLPGRAAASEKKVDWTRVTGSEKQAFFQLMDGFFDKRTGGSRSSASSTAYAAQPAQPPTPNDRFRPQPTISPSSPSSTVNASLTSYPPATTTGSSGSDFVTDFLSPSTWSTRWYTQGPNSLPPSLKNRKDIEWTGSMSTYGPTKTLIGAVRFADLSFAYYKIVMQGNGEPQREAKAVGRPKALDGQMLYEAHETYGEIVAGFAEDAERSGSPVARGECWDMANEALIACSQYDVPAPVRSINRTHGHLIFEGRAWGKRPEDQIGRWRGGDTSVRRGDIVEWNTVTIRELGAPRGSWSTLGDPEHTAVIISDSPPSETPSNGQDIKPATFGSLEVIEQSQGKTPSRSAYDLSAFEKGEMWIYRPISSMVYLGRELKAEY